MSAFCMNAIVGRGKRNKPKNIKVRVAGRLKARPLRNHSKSRRPPRKGRFFTATSAGSGYPADPAGNCARCWRFSRLKRPGKEKITGAIGPRVNRPPPSPGVIRIRGRSAGVCSLSNSKASISGTVVVVGFSHSRYDRKSASIRKARFRTRSATSD